MKAGSAGNAGATGAGTVAPRSHDCGLFFVVVLIE